MRIVRPRQLAPLLIVGAIAALLLCRTAVAQETITITEEPGMSAAPQTGPAAGDCGCNGLQRPPWHGNVHGDPCGPVCGRGCGGVFHANPCHQLHLRAYARANCMTLPPCFPRLSSLCREGYLPSPAPLCMPRCHQCGAVIDGGY